MPSGLTDVYSLPYPLNTDPVDVADDVKALAVAVDSTFVTKSNLASPVFTGVPAAPTAATDTSTTQIATTQFVINQGYLKETTASANYAPISSPTFTGTPLLTTTPTAGDNTTKIASTAFVTGGITTHSGLTTGIHGVGAGAVVGTTLTQTLTNKTMDGTLNTFQNIPQSAVTGLSGQYSPLNLTITSRTSNYTLQLTDAATQVEMSVATANTITVPPESSVNFAIGAQIIIAQTGTGQTTITPGVGVIINGTPGLKLRTQWSVATLIKRASNTWIVSGDVIA